MEALYNLDMERALLSSVFFEPFVLEDVSARIGSEAFYIPFHRNLFSAMLELSREERPIDEEFVKSKMIKRKEWDEAAMLDILSANPITALEPYIDMIAEMARKRGFVNLGLSIKKMIESDDKSSVDVASGIDKSIDKIMDIGSKHSVKTSADFIEEMRSDINAAAEAGDIIGYKTGINSLDAKVGAFQLGDLVVIAARPSMGKTSLMTTITDYALGKGHGVYMNSLEMSGKKIMARLVATRSGISLSDIKRGHVTEKDRFESAVKFYTKTNLLHIVDESYLSIAEIKAKAAQHFRKHPEVKYWFIDHIRYIKKPGVNIPNEINEITKELKRTAKQYGVVVVLLSQLNRANEQRTNKRPILSDLRESGAIEEDADVIIFPHRDSYYQRNVNDREPEVAEAELNVGKNRDGEAGICKCYFKGSTASFENYGGIEYTCDSTGHVLMPII